MPAGTVRLPERRLNPPSALAARAVVGLGLLVLTALIVWLQRHGYHDASRPGRPIRLVDAVYYSAVTLSTTGYGDIVPVSTTARLVNTFVLSRGARCWPVPASRRPAAWWWPSAATTRRC